MQIDRWPSTARGRSRIVAFNGCIWTVANTVSAGASFEVQAAESLDMLEAHLREAGSARTHLLSVQVLLTDISRRAEFDSLWQAWIGADPACWPQRACYQAELAPGLLIELISVATLATALNRVRPHSE
jgi:enamine deaminase RidA (YjgF/YER057c/UK114 family)